MDSFIEKTERESKSQSPPDTDVQDVVELTNEESDSSTASFRPLAGGKDVSLQDLPNHKKPESFDTGTYVDYLWELTEDGRKQAAAIVARYSTSKKTVKNDDQRFTHMCIACFESGEPLYRAFFKYGGTNQANRSKHHKTHTKDAGDEPWTGFVIDKIRELRGIRCGFTARQVISKDGTLVQNEPPATRDDFLRVVAKWVAVTAQPLSATEHPWYREMIRVARTVANPADLIVGNHGLRSTLLKLNHERNVMHSDYLRGKKRRAFVVFDGWDGFQKVIGFSLFYISDAKPTLQLVAYPISFAFAQLSMETNQMSGEKETISLLEESLKQKDVDMSVLAGAKSDNAMANTIATLNKPGIEFYSGGDEGWHDTANKEKIGCVSHLAHLAVQYAIGDKTAQGKGEDPIPKPPSNEHVQLTFKAALTANNWLSNEKNWQRAMLVAKEGNVDLFHPVVANATRWTSHLNMLSRAIDNAPVFALLAKEKARPEFPSAERVRTMTEFEAILEPIAMFQGISQTNTKPFGPATLPSIVLLLNRYGIKVSSLFVRYGAEVDQEVKLKLAFEVRGPGRGPERRVVKAENMSGEAKSLLQSLQEHLIFRFVTQRGNRFLFEVVGMFVDPVMKEYAKRVCTPTPSEDPSGNDYMWFYEDVCARVEKCLTKFAPKKDVESSECSSTAHHLTKKNVVDVFESDDSDEEQDIRPTTRSEFHLFEGEKHPLMAGLDKRELKSFATFLSIFEQYDPLDYWSKIPNKQRFPTLYAANLVTLAYQSSSAYEEGVFSTSAYVLTDSRNRLYESPLLCDAVVGLKHCMAREVSSQEKLRKGEQNTKKMRMTDDQKT